MRNGVSAAPPWSPLVRPPAGAGDDSDNGHGFGCCPPHLKSSPCACLEKITRPNHWEVPASPPALQSEEQTCSRLGNRRRGLVTEMWDHVGGWPQRLELGLRREPYPSLKGRASTRAPRGSCAEGAVCLIGALVFIKEAATSPRKWWTKRAEPTPSLTACGHAADVLLPRLGVPLFPLGTS